MSDAVPKTWFALDVVVEPNAREAVEYALMEAGALGTETNDSDDKRLGIAGYFDRVPDREAVRAKLADALRIYDLPSLSVRTMSVREVVDRDWLAEWKSSWQPVRIGQRFIVAPPWSEVEADDRAIVRIEPGMAFGTGTHETTRLCLNAVEKHFSGGSFLDVGTGTGILAIAAAKLAPTARVEACDTDPAAVEIAKENAELNGVGDRIRFWVGSIAPDTASADVVCANLTAEVIAPLLPGLLSLTCSRLILSGVLDTQEEMITRGLAECGVNKTNEVMHDGEWIAIVV